MGTCDICEEEKPLQDAPGDPEVKVCERCLTAITDGQRIANGYGKFMRIKAGES